MEIKNYQNCGVYYYEKLPKKFIVATEKDFENIAAAQAIEKPFLILGYHWPVYQCRRVRKNFNMEVLKPFLEAGRVFVLR